MQKFFIGLLLGLAIGGAYLLIFRGPEIKRVRADLDRVNGSYEEVQSISNILSTDVDGLTDDIAGINTESGETISRLDGIRQTASDNTDSLRLVSGKVDELEGFNIEFIRLGRNIGDISFDIRRFSESYGEK